MTPPVALTSGDPNGVGLELTGQAWKNMPDKPFFVIADINHVKQATNVPVIAINQPSDTQAAFTDALPVIHLPFATERQAGVSDPKNAKCIIRSIEMAVNFVENGQASSLCTNPINKKILKDGADFPYPGHTEFLAHLGGVDISVMMLMAPELRAIPTTIHIPLEHVPTALTAELLERTIMITHHALIRDFALTNPTIAVAGLNPHAGEAGTMGTEELEFIVPLIRKLTQKGLSLIGPLPADTMFHEEARKKYDAAICMYHDQALIPLKTLNFFEGVNTTLGLPFIRTSPDHGTAFDIAGKGIADPRSLIAAIKQASEMATNRARYDNVN